MPALYFSIREVITMSDEQRFGDGQDNYLQGMRQAAEAVRQFGSAAGAAGAAGTAAGGKQ